MLNLDVTQFLSAHFADNSSLRDVFQMYRQDPPSLDQMRQWRRRERIPADWLPRVLYIIEIHTGHPPYLAAHMNEGDASCRLPLSPKSKSTGEPVGIFD